MKGADGEKVPEFSRFFNKSGVQMSYGLLLVTSGDVEGRAGSATRLTRTFLTAGCGSEQVIAEAQGSGMFPDILDEVFATENVESGLPTVLTFGETTGKIFAHYTYVT